jgi:hypothetical protein
VSADKVSASLAVLAALFVVLASNKQWWTVSMDGVLVTRRWANRMLVIVAGLLVTSLVALWVGSGGWALVVAVVGIAVSVVTGWFFGSLMHDRNVAKFKRNNAGLAGSPLDGGDFD